MSSNHFCYHGQNSSFFIFCPVELTFGTGVNSEALISNSSTKIRYKYVLKEKKAIFFNEKLNVLPKCSLTKVLPWQHLKLFQMMPHIIILKVRKFHQSTGNCFGMCTTSPPPALAWIGLTLFSMGYFNNTTVWGGHYGPLL